ncbi:MAG: glycosyltransferase family 2 protein [Gemmatimonadetes bacterium]|nr:glycosyltransferase family 2 protein [Gemmatimonadota bacterium]MDA1103901.1 glycosyltransferase family 2 protein [Gemmatimonadota bacterium]
MTPFLFALPWLGILVFLLFVVRVPRELPSGDRADADRPFVSIIVPARNESINIENCLTSLTASTYPAFEVIVVDDRSEDGTADIARSVSHGYARDLRVVAGADLPEGWLGKPWACHQGALVARGDLLLFTDADTTHGPPLLSRAVAGMDEEGADLLTIVGRQLMETFWERLVQPQIFLVMLFRFPNFEKSVRNKRWRDAIANGQFLLYQREAYDALGGHEAVRDQVVEDLALAQITKREGRRLRMRSAEADFATRMYRSLGELVAGWSKNLVLGGLQSVPAPLRPIVAPASLVAGVGLWLVPPFALLVASLGWAGGLAGPVFLWSIAVCAVSALAFALFTSKMGAPAAYGLLYPLGAAVGTYIFLRSWIRGRNVEWKGRRYRVRPLSDRA